MPTEKPLPDADDDIIDLTDLVEEGGVKADTADSAGPADLSFENELDDLFSDVAPETPAAETAAADDDADLIDLAGLELDEPTEPTTEQAAPGVDDALADLFGEVDAAATATPSAPDAFGELPELGAVAEDAAAAPPATETESLSFDDIALDFEPATAETATGDEASDDVTVDLPDLDAVDVQSLLPETPPSEAAEPEIEPDAIELSEAEEAEPETALDSEAMDVADLDLTAPDEASQPDLLGSLPGIDETQEAVDVAELPEITPLAEPVAPEAPSPEPAMAAAAPSPSGGIDLGALDKLIDSAKGPLPEPEPEAPAASAEALAALTDLAARIEALETANTALTEKLEALSAAPDEQALAEAVSARLEGVLSERLESLSAGQTPPVDVEALKHELQADIQAASPDQEALLARLTEALEPQFAALRQDLPQADALARKDETAAALEGLREAVARLEALSQGRQTQFDDFAGLMETNLAELRRELPEPEAFVSPRRLSEDLELLRETLVADLTESLESRFTAVIEAAKEAARQEVAALGEALTGRIEALEGTRIDPEAITADARQAAQEEAGALGEALTGRIEALEGSRVDPEAVTTEAKQAAHEEVTALGETLTGRIEALEGSRVDPEAVTAAARQAAHEETGALGEALTARIDALEGSRIDPEAVTADARQAAHEEAGALAEALSGRIEALEKDRIDPDALAEQVRSALSLPDQRDIEAASMAAGQAEQQAAEALAKLDGKLGREELDEALSTLRGELTSQIEQTVPRAAATVIREEIAALAKDFLE